MRVKIEIDIKKSKGQLETTRAVLGDLILGLINARGLIGGSRDIRDGDGRKLGKLTVYDM